MRSESQKKSEVTQQTVDTNLSRNALQKRCLSTAPGSLLNNLPYEISGDRSGAPVWDILTALKAALQFLFPLYVVFLSPSPNSHLSAPLHSFAKLHSASNVKNVTGKKPAKVVPPQPYVIFTFQSVTKHPE